MFLVFIARQYTRKMACIISYSFPIPLVISAKNIFSLKHSLLNWLLTTSTLYLAPYASTKVTAAAAAAACIDTTLVFYCIDYNHRDVKQMGEIVERYKGFIPSVYKLY